MQAAPQTRKFPALELESKRRLAGRFDGRLAKRQVWLDALFVWAVTRALLLGLTYLVPALSPSGGAAIKSLPTMLRAWYSQDGAQFIYIAQHGYDQWWRTAFFPLFPLLEHVLAPIFGGDYGLAGLVVSNVAFLGALVILRDLVERDFGADTAHRAIFYLAIFPTAFYFFAPYSESLYLCLSLGAFSSLRQRRWWLAGALGGVAALARSSAVLLLVPFAVEFLLARRYRLVRWWQSLAALLIPAGTGVYALYCQIHFHNPLAFSQAEGYWTRSLQWPGEGIVAAISALRAGNGPGVTLTHLALNLAAIVAFLVLGAIVLWRLPRSYGLYTAALLIYFLLFPAAYATVALLGQGRFVAVLFPVFILLAQWGKRDRLHEALILAQVALLTVFVIHFFAASTWGNLPLWW
jgi:Mannosyltransferase (PIG-V)